jgi:hypothetical protein
MITVDQKRDVVRLYKKQAHTIKEIMALTGVRSEQTIYRILDDNGIPRLKVRKPVRQITICIDRETADILDGEKPKNISEWVCNMIKRGYNIS